MNADARRCRTVRQTQNLAADEMPTWKDIFAQLVVIPLKPIFSREAGVAHFIGVYRRSSAADSKGVCRASSSGSIRVHLRLHMRAVQRVAALGSRTALASRLPHRPREVAR